MLYWRFFVNLALMLIDAAMYIIAGATVLNLRHEATPLYSSRFNFTIDSTVYLIIVACSWVWSLYVAGIYHRHVMGDGYQLNVLLVKGMVVCWVVQCAFNYFFDLGLTLTSLCLVVIAGWLLTMVERIASRAFITRSRRKGAYAYGTVIIGSPHGIGRTLKFLGQRRQLNYRPVAVCPIHLNPDTGLIEQSTDHETLREEMQKNEGCQLPVLEYSDHNLAEQIIDMNAQTVMVADELHRYSDNYDIFSVRMESFGLEIAVLASAADTSNHEIQVRSIQGTTIITQRLAQYTPARRMAKRLFDLVISSLAIICSLIITIPVAIAIKVTDGGPVFYKQTRMGLRGKPFQMYKFRSMRVNVQQETGWSTDCDPRKTHFGSFIRKFSLDELPQFFNVLKGDMSLVGPRPEVPYHVEHFKEEIPRYLVRQQVRPGCTGWAQIHGLRGDTDIAERIRYDIWYIENWTVALDIKIIFRTVFGGKMVNDEKLQ